MARSFVTPAQRKRRIFRDILLLAVILVVLVLRLDFPILTAQQALEATQDRYLFGPGEVITTLDYSREANKVKIGQYDRYYILRHGDWYAWCGVNHYGLQPESKYRELLPDSLYVRSRLRLSGGPPGQGLRRRRKVDLPVPRTGILGHSL